VITFSFTDESAGERILKIVNICPADNTSMFSCLRTLTTWHCPHPAAAATARLLPTAGRAAVDQYLLPAGFTATNRPAVGLLFAVAGSLHSVL